jgi:hypothetical protein
MRQCRQLPIPGISPHTTDFKPPMPVNSIGSSKPLNYRSSHPGAEWSLHSISEVLASRRRLGHPTLSRSQTIKLGAERNADEQRKKKARTESQYQQGTPSSPASLDCSLMSRRENTVFCPLPAGGSTCSMRLPPPSPCRSQA